jgi:Restriction endonuclease
MDTRIEKGSKFELRVASLLRSSPGYRNVREQQHIRGKNVDIVFQKQWNPHRDVTIGVECKDWKGGLNRQAVQQIYLDHKPLLDERDIDEIWIVTPHPVSPTVQEYADSFRGLEILHINEFEQDVIDFSLYTEYLSNRFSHDRLSQYYIPSRLENSAVTLHDRVAAWIESASNQPIAVWAGYGMGKASYAIFLASTLAAQFNANRSKRIPILIPLGDFYTAPRIDGLFANVLTNEYGVHGYNFNTFWNLHEAGRFIIILDGFDEMKVTGKSTPPRFRAIELRHSLA